MDQMGYMQYYRDVRKFIFIIKLLELYIIML